VPIVLSFAVLHDELQTGPMVAPVALGELACQCGSACPVQRIEFRSECHVVSE
jgi:hypothetical protein